MSLQRLRHKSQKDTIVTEAELRLLLSTKKVSDQGKTHVRTGDNKLQLVKWTQYKLFKV